MTETDRPLKRYDRVKRALDFVLASVGLVASVPIQVGVAVVVKRKLGSPVLFSQERPGRNGVIFKMYKFRSMLDVNEAAGLVTDEQRLTRFGQVLRSSSLDELPALINVIKGDMSLVGPRPLLVRYLPRYSVEQARRHEVRPGITGLAQVSGRNALSWADKFRLDVEYVDNRSFALDAKIIARTIMKVFVRDGISADGEATMSEFMGAQADS